MCQTRGDNLLFIALVNLHAIDPVRLDNDHHHRRDSFLFFVFFLAYLSHWYEMQEQVYEDRRQFEHLIHLTHRFEQLEEHFHGRFVDEIHCPSLIALRDDLLNQLKFENEIRIELSHMINQHYPDGPLIQLSTK